MAAVVGHLGHDVSTDVVGCCDVCFASVTMFLTREPVFSNSRCFAYVQWASRKKRISYDFNFYVASTKH